MMAEESCSTFVLWTKPFIICSVSYKVIRMYWYSLIQWSLELAGLNVLRTNIGIYLQEIRNKRIFAIALKKPQKKLYSYKGLTLLGSCPGLGGPDWMESLAKLRLMYWIYFPLVTFQVEACFTHWKSYFCNIIIKTLKSGVPKLGGNLYNLVKNMNWPLLAPIWLF